MRRRTNSYKIALKFALKSGLALCAWSCCLCLRHLPIFPTIHLATLSARLTVDNLRVTKKMMQDVGYRYIREIVKTFKGKINLGYTVKSVT